MQPTRHTAIVAAHLCVVTKEIVKHVLHQDAQLTTLQVILAALQQQLPVQDTTVLADLVELHLQLATEYSTPLHTTEILEPVLLLAEQFVTTQPLQHPHVLVLDIP